MSVPAFDQNSTDLLAPISDFDTLLFAADGLDSSSPKGRVAVQAMPTSKECTPIGADPPSPGMVVEPRRTQFREDPKAPQRRIAVRAQPSSGREAYDPRISKGKRKGDGYAAGATGAAGSAGDDRSGCWQGDRSGGWQGGRSGGWKGDQSGGWQGDRSGGRGRDRSEDWGGTASRKAPSGPQAAGRGGVASKAIASGQGGVAAKAPPVASEARGYAVRHGVNGLTAFGIPGGPGGRGLPTGADQLDSSGSGSVAKRVSGIRSDTAWDIGSEAPRIWAEVIDERTGETYYWNTSSDETTFFKPEGINSEDMKTYRFPDDQFRIV